MNNFCEQSAKIWQIVGYAVTIVKIVIPIIIIILGIIAFAQAVMSDDEKEINKKAVSLGKKLALGVLIFFVPTIVDLVFGMVNGFNKEVMEKTDYMKCEKCITKPSECDTSYDGGIFK